MRCRRATVGVVFLVVVIVFSFLGCLFVWVLVKREDRPWTPVSVGSGTGRVVVKDTVLCIRRPIGVDAGNRRYTLLLSFPCVSAQGGVAACPSLLDCSAYPDDEGVSQ